MPAKTSAPEPAATQGGDDLVRGLNLFGAISMIVGIVIGSGIFLGVNRIAIGTGSPSMIVLVWVLAGFLTLMGALTYAELGTMFPKAGGEYVFLKEGMGSFAAFLSGWTAFTINLAGSAAALGLIFAEQLNQLKPLGYDRLVFFETSLAGIPVVFDSVKLTAVCLIGLLATINYFGLRYGGGVQMVFTVLKGALIIFLAVAALFYFGAPASPEPGLFSAEEYQVLRPDGDGGLAAFSFTGFELASFFTVAMVAALFAFDGWTNVVRVGSEIKDPSRNIPRAMLLGTLAVLLLYLLVTFGYLNVLGYQGLADGRVVGFDNERTVASNAAQVLFGPAGRSVVAAMILVSVFGTLNGITLSGPRIYYAMSRDRLFPRLFGKVSRHHTPHYAILFQSLLAIFFLTFFDFHQLTRNVVFISFLFYALAATGLLVLRRTHPDAPRPYRVWGYPYVPILFIAMSLTFVAYQIYDQFAGFSPQDVSRLVGLLIVFAGVPVYLFFRARLARECRDKGLTQPAPMFGPDPHAAERAKEATQSAQVAKPPAKKRSPGGPGKK